jgi:hypothetical protein
VVGLAASLGPPLQAPARLDEMPDQFLHILSDTRDQLSGEIVVDPALLKSLATRMWG